MCTRAQQLGIRWQPSTKSGPVCTRAQNRVTQRKLTRKGKPSNSPFFSRFEMSSFGRFPAWGTLKGCFTPKAPIHAEFGAFHRNSYKSLNYVILPTRHNLRFWPTCAKLCQLAPTCANLCQPVPTCAVCVAFVFGAACLLVAVLACLPTTSCRSFVA